MNKLDATINTSAVAPAEAGRSDRNNNFNLIRLVLAGLVLLSHSFGLIDGNTHRELLTVVFHTLSFGELAVDGFFLLSGFLILKSWQANPNLFEFLKKRVLRIYPGFIVASLICVLVVGPLGTNGLAYLSHVHVGRVVRSVILLREPDAPPSFVGSFAPRLNGSMWTIKFEFACYALAAACGCCTVLGWRKLYIVLPVLAMFLSIMSLPGGPPWTVSNLARCMLLVSPLAALSACGWRRAWLAITVAVLAVYFGGNVAYKLCRPDLLSFVVQPGDFMRLAALFCAGGCFYIYHDRIKYTSKMASVAAVLLCVCMFTEKTAAIGVPLFGGYVLFWFAFARIQSIAGYQKRSDISYGVYLYAWPVQKLLLWYIPHLSPWTLFPLAAVGSCACGLVSWHVIEQPWLRLARSKSK